MPDIPVSIVIPTWNRWHVLARCVEAVHRHTNDDYELIIIDNGSVPRGFVWAANHGLRIAGGDVLVILSDDVVVTPNWLPPLRKALADGLWAASATNIDQDRQVSTENWTLNAHCCAFSRTAYSRLNGYNERYKHWLADWEIIDRITAMGGKYGRVWNSCVFHLKEPLPSDPELLATMRSWHMNDYGTKPGW